MAKIILETLINAPVKRCFDLSRSIDLHKISTAKTKEEAIAGRTTGLIEEGEFVTWRAIHLGIKQTLTVKIIKVESPNYFRDEMLKGAFKGMWHEHIFEEQNGQTLMKDVFVFESPLGFIGKAFNTLFLANYMKGFLLERNAVIKQIAESEDWKKLLPH